jgi:hypothetical protein
VLCLVFACQLIDRVSGALDVVQVASTFVLDALESAAVRDSILADSRPSQLDAPLIRILSLCHGLLEYVDSSVARLMTLKLNLVFESLPQASSLRIFFAVSFAERLRADLQVRFSNACLTSASYV